MIRDILMVFYALAWLFAVVMTQLRTGTVPYELWAGLGVGVGALLAVFRGERYLGQHHRVPPQDTADMEDIEP